MAKDPATAKYPEISRHQSTAGTPEGAAQAIATAFVKDGFTVILVSHDGQAAPPGCIASKPGELASTLGLTLCDELDQLRVRKVIVVIDAQPVFHEGKAYHPIKPSTVTALVCEMQTDYPDDDLAGIYVYE
ncbi:hypothetical protein V8Z74_19385 [Comamonas sp. w2-DMI]|uniref:hypothetical protein n=1 Tax=Comamonas sp. w2-DMI TaxID=3126391 RepID=UPI0032E4B8C8